MPWVIKMPIEIERKFLVNSNAYKENAQKHEIKQVYLSATDKMAIRVRIDGIQATLAIKSKESDWIIRGADFSSANRNANSNIGRSLYIL